VNRFEVYAYIGNQTHENKGRAVKCFSIVKFHLQRAKKKDDFIRCSLLAFCFSAGWVSTYTRHNTIAAPSMEPAVGRLAGGHVTQIKIPSFHCLSLDRITDWMAQPFYINR
jgi:hypothetical protein